jgi:hypothetical protein
VPAPRSTSVPVDRHGHPELGRGLPPGAPEKISAFTTPTVGRAEFGSDTGKRVRKSWDVYPTNIRYVPARGEGRIVLSIDGIDNISVSR